MKKASRLHNALKSWIAQDAHWGHLSHLTTCILLVVALIQTGSVSLTKWADRLSTWSVTGRWACPQNTELGKQIGALDKRLSAARGRSSNWTEDVIYLALDTSLFWDEYCLIRLSVIHRGRGIPVTWRVLEHKECQCIF